MKKLFVVLVIAAAAFFAGRYSLKRTQQEGSGGRKILYWVDPMHPAYKSDRPGIAPDCGMQLEPVYADQAAPAQPSRKILYYRDAKAPGYKSAKPGLNPETGNELEPVYEEPVPGTVQIPAEKQQMIGVRYGTPEWTEASLTIRASGKVAVDETRIAKVHSKVEGWIERTLVDFNGKYVEKGQPLLTLYSPELLASQQEYLLALKSRDILAGSGMEHVVTHGRSMAEAARKRLQLWDLTDEQIGELERTGSPVKNITLFSPASGYVTARNAYPNQKIVPDTELYAITDMSRVWIVADVFESDMPHVRMGQAAMVKTSYNQGRAFRGRVSYILPQVDPETRTLKVRIEAENPDTALKPEMFVEVEFPSGLGRLLSVPADAVLDSGVKKTVFVDAGNGYLEPRQVETGERMGDRVEIVRGLKAGERIVTSGTFLIDSESQMKAAAQGMGSPHD
jgi:multidrug efflux pump subunit AcrA (membrane-fusion protein)